MWLKGDRVLNKHFQIAIRKSKSTRQSQCDNMKHPRIRVRMYIDEHKNDDLSLCSQLPENCSEYTLKHYSTYKCHPATFLADHTCAPPSRYYMSQETSVFCTPCDAGKSSEVASTACSECPAGTKSSTASPSCTVRRLTSHHTASLSAFIHSAI